jgi:hypothetical protein
VRCHGCGTHLNVRLGNGLQLCRECRAERNRTANRTSTLTGLTDDGRLKVSCWCEAAFVLVLRGDVLRGRTRSCGRQSCREAA